MANARYLLHATRICTSGLCGFYVGLFEVKELPPLANSSQIYANFIRTCKSPSILRP